MNPLHSRIMVTGLLLSPPLFAASEAARLTVDNSYGETGSDPVADAALHLDAVARHSAAWHAAGGLQVAFVVTWCIALLAMTLVLARSRTVLAAVGGGLAAVSVAGAAMHFAFYYLPLAELATVPDRAFAARAGAALDGGDPLSVVALLMFLVGTAFAPLLLGIGLWRAGVLPWWAAAALLAWLAFTATGSQSFVAPLAHLLLLVPAGVVARCLLPETNRLGSPVPA